MKFTAGLLTEITNILIIVQSKDIENCIKDFIAFGFICEIDDLILNTVTSIDCNDEINRAGIAFPKKQFLKTFYDSYVEIWYQSQDELEFTWKVVNTVQIVL